MPTIATLMGRPRLHKRCVFKRTRGHTGRMCATMLSGFESDRPFTDTCLRNRPAGDSIVLWPSFVIVDGADFLIWNIQ
jgi:hypothetical protein